MPDAINAVRQLIEGRLQDIEAEAWRLRRAGDHLQISKASGGPRRNSRQAKAAAPSKERKSRSNKRSGIKRARRGERRDQLLAVLKAEPKLRPSEVAERLGIKNSQASALLSKARADGLVAKKAGRYSLKKAR